MSFDLKIFSTHNFQNQTLWLTDFFSWKCTYRSSLSIIFKTKWDGSKIKLNEQEEEQQGKQTNVCVQWTIAFMFTLEETNLKGLHIHGICVRKSQTSWNSARTGSVINCLIRYFKSHLKKFYLQRKPETPYTQQVKNFHKVFTTITSDS